MTQFLLSNHNQFVNTQYKGSEQPKNSENLNYGDASHVIKLMMFIILTMVMTITMVTKTRTKMKK